jgi:hypothetical protein
LLITAMEQSQHLRPPSFDGLEEQWQEWSFVMRAFLGGQHERSQELLEAAESRDDLADISLAHIFAALGEDGSLANKKMYFALVMTAKGSAQMILRSAERHNGAACWRALCRRFEPATAVRAQSIMQGILNVGPFPDTISEFEEKHGEWERDIKRYEAASGEVFNLGVKKSIFLQNAPKNLRTLLQMQSTRTYEELVGTVVQYLQVSTVYDGGVHKADKTGANAMEVDALTRGGKTSKGGGKGQSKGDKTKGKAEKAVLCFECGKPGHYARDCWYRQDKGATGKGKGKTDKVGSVHELTMDSSADSVAASSVGTTASAAGGHIRVITTRPCCEDSQLEGGFIFAVTNSDKDTGKIMMLTDNCADEHVCGVDDFSWVPLIPSQNPGLSLADGSPLGHYGMRRVPLRIAGDRTIIVEFQVTDVRKPILSVGKFCSRAPQRSAWYDAQGGVLRHESAGLVKVK